MQVSRRRTIRRAAQRVLVVVFFIAMVGMLVLAARTLDWPAIATAVRSYSTATLIGAALLSLAGYAACSAYDILGRRYVGHSVATPAALAAGFVAYAFTINMSSLIGSWGSRLRLYSRLGLTPSEIVRHICVCIISNWSGFLFLAGGIFLFSPPPLPPSWPVHGDLLRAVGALLLLVVAAYLMFCAMKHRGITIKGVELHAPSLRFAAMQLVLSCISWTMIVTVLNLLLPAEIPLLTVMGILFISSVANLMVHMPSGAGVIEAVFLGLLGQQYESHVLMGALLTFRGAYYLMPLACALVVYIVMELRARNALRFEQKKMSPVGDPQRRAAISS